MPTNINTLALRAGITLDNSRVANTLNRVSDPTIIDTPITHYVNHPEMYAQPAFRLIYSRDYEKAGMGGYGVTHEIAVKHDDIKVIIYIFDHPNTYAVRIVSWARCIYKFGYCNADTMLKIIDTIASF